MNKPMTAAEVVTAQPGGLALMRVPFEPHQIGKLAKPYKKDSPKGKCAECGGFHGLPAVHLDYVGHAALTDRLLNVDPEWSWEPVALGTNGLPALDANNGLWIRLTVCGVTRLGYGHAGEKRGGDAIKETVGDALRNAAMRFGAALDLWHKGDLHGPSDEADAPSSEADAPQPLWRTAAESAIIMLRDAPSCEAWWKNNVAMLRGYLSAGGSDADHANAVIAHLKRCKEGFAPTEQAPAKEAAPSDPFDDQIPF